MGLRVAKFMKKQLEAANHTVELCGMLLCVKAQHWTKDKQ